MALLSVRALHNVLTPAQREWERWMLQAPCTGESHGAEQGNFPPAGAAGHHIHEGALSRVSLQPLLSLPLWSGARVSGLYLWL